MALILLLEKEKEEVELRGCLHLLTLEVLKSAVTILIDFIFTCPISFSALSPFVLTSLSLYICLSLSFSLTSSLPPLPSSLRYSTSFLSPVKVTPNRTSSASVTSSVSSRGSSPGLESLNTKVAPDEMSDGEFYYYFNN